MIVEYGAAPSADGRFRKYSAYKVGPTVYPQHCFINENWYIKFPSTRFTEADRAESRAYVDDNPHAAQIERVFALAGIDYGRIDYGIVDGQVQTFEINNNPTVLTRPPGWEAGVDYSRYADLHAKALRDIIRPASTAPLLKLGAGSRSVNAIHAEAMRRVRRRIAWFSLRRSLSLRWLKKRLANRFRAWGTPGLPAGRDCRPWNATARKTLLLTCDLSRKACHEEENLRKTDAREARQAHQLDGSDRRFRGHSG